MPLRGRYGAQGAAARGARWVAAALAVGAAAGVRTLEDSEKEVPFPGSIARQPLIFGAGQGTTGTNTIFYATCALGLQGIHCGQTCYPAVIQVEGGEVSLIDFSEGHQGNSFNFIGDQVRSLQNVVSEEVFLPDEFNRFHCGEWCEPVVIEQRLSGNVQLIDARGGHLGNNYHFLDGQTLPLQDVTLRAVPLTEEFDRLKWCVATGLPRDERSTDLPIHHCPRGKADIVAWSEKIRALLRVVVESEVRTVHDSPYAYLAPDLIEMATEVRGVPPIVILSRRDPVKWAERRIEEHPMAPFCSAAINASQLHLAFDWIGCIEAGVEKGFDDLSSIFTTFSQVEPARVSDAIQAYQDAMESEAVYVVDLFAADPPISVNDVHDQLREFLVDTTFAP